MLPSHLPRHYVLFVNPNAGRGAAPRIAGEVARLLQAAGHLCETVSSQDAEAALAHARSLPKDAAVVAVGGDGTLSALLPAAVCTGRPLGLIPAGRGDDLAYALGWRDKAPTAAAARLQGVPRALDVLRVSAGGSLRYSLNGLGMGFDAQVAAYAAGMPRALGGFGGYAVGVVLAFRELRLRGLEISIDGSEVFSGPSFLAAVMNGRRYGGGFRISPRGVLTDGRLEVLAGREVGRAALLPLIARLLVGRHLDHPRVFSGQGRSVLLRWELPTPLHIDGDLCGPVSEVRVGVVPGGVRMLGA